MEITQDIPLQIVSQGLLIGGSIVFEMAIWDYFVHAWQQRLDQQVYDKVMNMALIIKPDEEASTHVE